MSTPTATHRPFPSLTEVTRPTFLEPTYLSADRYDYNYDNYFRYGVQLETIATNAIVSRTDKEETICNLFSKVHHRHGRRHRRA